MVSHNKKGQAALEFLSTYGFAFLIILVMVGALAYFGVLNPQRFLPERCQFEADMPCVEYQLVDAGADLTLNFIIQNNIGSGTSITGANIVVSDLTGNTGSCAPAGATNVPAGQRQQFACTVAGAGDDSELGQKYRLDVIIEHTPTGGTFTKRVGGDVFAEVQP